MLEFAIRYCVAIDAMTTVCEFNLQKYELGLDEWKITIVKASMGLDSTTCTKS